MQWRDRLRVQETLAWLNHVKPLPTMHPSEVVDLGCGCGLLAHLALHSAAPASSATAVEIAPHLARLAQRLLPGDRVPWQHLVAR